MNILLYPPFHGCGYLVLIGSVTLPNPLSWDTVVSPSGQSVKPLCAVSAGLVHL